MKSICDRKTPQEYNNKDLSRPEYLLACQVRCYRRWLGFLLRLFEVLRVLINSLVRWFYTGTVGLVLFRLVEVWIFDRSLLERCCFCCFEVFNVCTHAHVCVARNVAFSLTQKTRHWARPAKINKYFNNNNNNNNNNNGKVAEHFRRLKGLYRLKKSTQLANSHNDTNQWYVDKQTKHANGREGDGEEGR